MLRFIAVLGILSAIPISIVAETPSIRVVRMQALIEESIAGKAARADLEKELKTARAEMEREKLQLQKMAEDLKSQGMLLSKEALEKKRDKIRAAERDFQRKAKDLSDDMQRKTARSVDGIVKEAKEILARLAEEEGFDFILESNKRFVLYADSNIDITDRVLKALDEKKLDL
jgi:outer membrane protein